MTVPPVTPAQPRLPQARFNGVSRAFTLDTIFYRIEKYGSGCAGYVIPPFQRPLVWTEAQSINFIESAVLGLHLGHFLYNVCPDGAANTETDLWLLDGQQRMTAIQQFVANAFPVFGLFHRDLTPRERFRLGAAPFPAIELNSDDPDHLRQAYNRTNFAGTRHTEDQRA